MCQQQPWCRFYERCTMWVERLREEWEREGWMDDAMRWYPEE